jgi:hypothetical protein
LTINTQGRWFLGVSSFWLRSAEGSVKAANPDTDDKYLVERFMDRGTGQLSHWNVWGSCPVPRELGKDGVDDTVIDELSETLTKEQAERIADETRNTTSWVFEAAQELKEKYS